VNEVRGGIRVTRDLVDLESFQDQGALVLHRRGLLAGRARQGQPRGRTEWEAGGRGARVGVGANRFRKLDALWALGRG
jgi:hypothetical protein